MEFTLFYRGELKANGNPKHKQDIRRVIHSQMKNLWKLEPLKDCSNHLNENRPEGDICLIESKGNFKFAPLISKKLALAAELNIIMLRPEEPGKLISQSGDIDNRLKTLFDALSVPQHENQIPDGDNPSLEEKPFFCLLQDDELVYGINIVSERLLTGDHCSDNEVVLIIKVKTKVTKYIYAAMPFL